MKISRLMIVSIGTLSVVAGSASAGECEPQWDQTIGNPGLNWEVTGLGVVDLGSGPELYAAGFFTQAGGEPANRIARWDGSQWWPLGSGFNATITGNNPIIGFDDGTGYALYVGGSFATAGGVAANRIARWDGSTWSALGGGMNSNVNSLAIYNDGNGPALYAGGAFSTAGGVTANRVARWDGATWHPVGEGFDHVVHALKVFEGELYAGGRFTTADGEDANHVAKWNGKQWTPLGNGLGDFVTSLEIFDDGNGPALYAGGAFVQTGDSLGANRIAKWDGSTWSALGQGLTGGGFESRARALQTFHDGSGEPALYVVGDFTQAGTTPASGIARWTTTGEWEAVGSGTGEHAWHVGWSLTAFPQTDSTPPTLYVGGGFTEADGQPAKNIAAWRGCSMDLPPPVCPGDLTGDQNVGVPDLLALLACWGPAGPGCAAADLTGDDNVGVPDLLELLSEWGSCP